MMRFILVVSCLVMGASPLFSTETSGDFSLEDRKVENFQKDIVTAQDASNSAQLSALCQSAFKSGRYDLMLACFDSGIIPQFLDALSKEKDPIIRKVAVLAMLQGSPRSWHDRIPGSPVDSNTALYYPIATSAISVLRDTLPSDQIVIENFRSPEGRMKMADELKKFIPTSLIK